MPEAQPGSERQVFDAALLLKIDAFLDSQKTAIVPGVHTILIENCPSDYRNATEIKGSPIHKLNAFRARVNKSQEFKTGKIEVSYIVDKETKQRSMRIDIPILKK